VLKPNAYHFNDWLWLYKKIQARISIWAHQWLSRGGRLVLLNSVLSSIPMYWASIVMIQKGLLTKIRKLCFHFLQSGNKEIGGVTLVKWSRTAMPKESGGWGIKNIYWFCKSLAAKSLWRLIHNKMLWSRVMTSKYLSGMTIIEWIRSPRKTVINSSICWKAMVETFPLIGKWIVWNVGNGKSIRIGENPWVNSGEGFKLTKNLVNALHGRGIFTLWDAKFGDTKLVEVSGSWLIY
jgi:hypothetical protein